MIDSKAASREVRCFFVYLLQQKFRNMKEQTKKKIWESLRKLEETWDEHRQKQAIRRAYLFRDPTKKVLPS